MSAREEWSRVIARAWKDPDFMARLKANPKETIEDSVIREQLNLREIGGENQDYFPLDEIPESQRDLSETRLAEYIYENGEQIFAAEITRVFCF